MYNEVDHYLPIVVLQISANLDPCIIMHEQFVYPRSTIVIIVQVALY